MESSPAAAFEVIESHFLLEFFVVTLDAPAQLGQPNELFAGRIGRQRGQP
jgi:hypothetical protein